MKKTSPFVTARAAVVAGRAADDAGSLKIDAEDLVNRIRVASTEGAGLDKAEAKYIAERATGLANLADDIVEAMREIRRSIRPYR